MADPNISEKVDDLADGVKNAGRSAAEGARAAGESVGDALDDAGDAAERRLRRANRRGRAAYAETEDRFESEFEGIEDTIRRNPIAATGAALLVGVVLGRFFL
ncbi:ElaB/YqjD/DUF883 family membrane-anchored ribosome-binding protein [Methylopila capsulata]|uniref:ElaB/YqjD/DUF883 family membrane-anchored ribosome-binding protein n=1 Tax=Methylopila capsulata TaxID=61654 RepID=A0A9W6MTN6_9HYPH|nr:hypothetical protein [Methylopila capsulata]MBM7853353.1 ElaB/YqjD/DUF883 family membrane-anchored ribosome-binding protein [Methylopila capsulata]GLK57432.1 hypothetical protein GCM10008170_34520 [Methylopila capsulata]